MSYMTPPTSYYGMSEDEIQVAKEGERLRDMYAPGTDAHELGLALIRVAHGSKPTDYNAKRICPACYHGSADYPDTHLVALEHLGNTEVMDGVTEEAWKCPGCDGYFEVYWLHDEEGE